MFFKNHKLSVVVLFYNQAKFVDRCLKSILQQDIDCEIICVDDASDDNTNELLQKFQKQHNNLLIIRNNKNMGTCYSRYVGLKHCHGNYAMFIDGDDDLPEHCLSEILQKAKFVNADIFEFNALKDAKEKMYELNSGLVKDDCLIAHNQQVIKNNLWNKLISKRVYKKSLKKIDVVNVQHDNYSDVLLFLFHFLKHTKIVAQEDIVGYNYYTTSGMTHNSSLLTTLKHYCNFIATYEHLYDIYGETKELFHWKNIVCNQAIETYLQLSKDEKRKRRYLLNQLMTDEEIDLLIREKKKKK